MIDVIDWALVVVFLSVISFMGYSHWSDMRRMEKRAEQFKRLAEFWSQQDGEKVKR